MGRPLRAASGDLVYHVLNRANAVRTFFDDDGDYAWPMERPAVRFEWVNESETTEQLRAMRRSVTKGQPFGSPPWVEQKVTQWNLGVTIH